MENPDRISKAVLERGLDAQTAFEIVSIDIADIDVGQNIGARLQADQAEADTRVARAKAEERRALAMAREQEMKAQVARNRARRGAGRGRGAAGHGRRLPRRKSGGEMDRDDECRMMNDECPKFIIHHSAFIISPLSTDPLTHSLHGHRRLFALSRRHREEDQVLLRRDFLPELQKIDRMFEGEQFLACLQYLDGLLAQEPGRDRACLLATRCVLLRADRSARGRPADRRRDVPGGYPDNQIGLGRDGHFDRPRRRAGRPSISGQRHGGRARRARAAHLSRDGQVAAVLLHADFRLPARALLQLQADIARDDERPQSGCWRRFARRADSAAAARRAAAGQSARTMRPGRTASIEAWQAAGVGRWRTAAERLAALAAEAPDAPAVWRDLATLRGWLADNAGCIEALRKYAALRAAEPDGLEDAVEAEATAMFLSDDPLGDRLDMFKLVWTVKDADALNERFLRRRWSRPCASIGTVGPPRRRRRRRRPIRCWIGRCPLRPTGSPSTPCR